MPRCKKMRAQEGKLYFSVQEISTTMHAVDGHPGDTGSQVCWPNAHIMLRTACFLLFSIQPCFDSGMVDSARTLGSAIRARQGKQEPRLMGSVDVVTPQQEINVVVDRPDLQVCHMMGVRNDLCSSVSERKCEGHQTKGGIFSHRCTL
jgi:hypothetical protein